MVRSLRGSGLQRAGTMMLACTVLGLASAAIGAPVYRWVDENGVTHLSSEKPPPGVKAERIEIKSSSPAQRPGSASGAGGSRPASPEQLAGREEVLSNLKTRECVIALEALDRKTSGAEPTSAAEISRLKQTAEANCSRHPAVRREQEEMAARLRIANGPTCVDARNSLMEMMAPGSSASREQVTAQQAFVDEHCVSPVR